MSLNDEIKAVRGHVRRGRSHLVKQGKIIEDLRLTGSDTALAERVRATMKESLANHEDHLGKLLSAMAGSSREAAAEAVVLTWFGLTDEATALRKNLAVVRAKIAGQNQDNKATERIVRGSREAIARSRELLADLDQTIHR